MTSTPAVMTRREFARGPFASGAIPASETQAANRSGAIATQGPNGRTLVDRSESTRRQIPGFCAAIRVGTPLATGPAKAFASARACIRAHEAVVAKTRLAV
jgi:hypothetical protein